VNRSIAVLLLCIICLALVPPVSAALGKPFYPIFFTRIMIFGIAALSLDLILGYGGMLSFGHAVYLGIGCYSVGILSYYNFRNGLLHLVTAIIASGLAALLFGSISLRTTGIAFIMITMAFSQMVYFLGVSLKTYGGDDGLNIASQSDLFGYIDLGDPTVLYYVVLAFLVVFLLLSLRLVSSRFGMVIKGAKLNERRMAALGFKTFSYKLTAFVISGIMCGVAGVLLANLTLFVSPSITHWSRSGEIMVMVIIGGMGTLIGPVLGSVAYLFLEDVLSGITEHWQAVLGPILVMVVLFAKRGILGILHWRPATGRPRKVE
jgi:branched-chain amino acid transport system permease protein